MKLYKVTYKTYFNFRLKKIFFHGIETRPLYIQLTYKRRTMFFKSYYFELFLNKKYAITQDEAPKVPTLQAVIEKEEELLKFLITRLEGNFTLEEFKQAYDFYSKDLISETEDGFRAYLLIFLLGKKMSLLGRCLVTGSENMVLYKLVDDLRSSFTPKLYKELISESVSSGEPYFSLYNFTSRHRPPLMLSLSVMEFETGTTKTDFSAFLDKHYSSEAAKATLKTLDRWIKDLKEKAQNS